ncbi:MAG: hypothetical protein QW745_07650 [Thermoplasmata archaeon]
MIIYIAVYESREAYKIEAVDNDSAYDKAIDISHEMNIELLDIYSLSFKKDKLIRLEL